MPDIKNIDTSKYTTSGKISIDGRVWDISLPGAGRELQFSKIQRRVALLDKKIESGKYEEADLDQYDHYEDFMLSFFKSIFKDSTEDNSEVSEWVDKTPFGVIVQAFEDIKKAAESDGMSD